MSRSIFRPACRPRRSAFVATETAKCSAWLPPPPLTCLVFSFFRAEWRRGCQEAQVVQRDRLGRRLQHGAAGMHESSTACQAVWLCLGKFCTGIFTMSPLARTSDEAIPSTPPPTCPSHGLSLTPLSLFSRQPPIVPSVRHPGDTQNFEKYPEVFPEIGVWALSPPLSFTMIHASDHNLRFFWLRGGVAVRRMHAQ